MIRIKLSLVLHVVKRLLRKWWNFWENEEQQNQGCNRSHATARDRVGDSEEGPRKVWRQVDMAGWYLVRTCGWTIFVENICLNNICWKHMFEQYLLREYGWTIFFEKYCWPIFVEKIRLDNICSDNMASQYSRKYSWTIFVEIIWLDNIWENTAGQYLRTYGWTIFENIWLDNIWEHMTGQYLRTYGRTVLV